MFSDYSEEYYQKGIKYIEAGDYDKAVEVLSKSAELGNREAFTALGSACAEACDYEMAYKWYTEGVYAGSIQATFNLGQMYFEGEYVDQDYKKALEYFLLAYQNGFEYASYYLGAYAEYGYGDYEIDYEEAVEWYENGVWWKDTSSLVALGRCYELGHGVAMDKEKALQLYEQAANLGDEEGIRALIYIRNVEGMQS